MHVITLTDGHAAAKEANTDEEKTGKSELLIALELGSLSDFWQKEEVHA